MTAVDRRLSLVPSLAEVIPLPRRTRTADALAGLNVTAHNTVTRRSQPAGGWLVRVNGFPATGAERAVLDAAAHAGLIQWIRYGDGDGAAITTPTGDAALGGRPGGDAA